MTSLQKALAGLEAHVNSRERAVETRLQVCSLSVLGSAVLGSIALIFLRCRHHSCGTVDSTAGHGLLQSGRSLRGKNLQHACFPLSLNSVLCLAVGAAACGRGQRRHGAQTLRPTHHSRTPHGLYISLSVLRLTCGWFGVGSSGGCAARERPIQQPRRQGPRAETLRRPRQRPRLLQPLTADGCHLGRHRGRATAGAGRGGRRGAGLTGEQIAHAERCCATNSLVPPFCSWGLILLVV